MQNIQIGQDLTPLFSKVACNIFTFRQHGLQSNEHVHYLYAIIYVTS